MSDKVFLPSSIPDGYEYAQFNTNGSIRLYNKPNGQNETLHWYEIENQYSSGLVTDGYTTFSNYSSTNFYHVPVSREVFDRPDFFNIIAITLLLTISGLWLLNLFTSIVRKGGVLGGLF